MAVELLSTYLPMDRRQCLATGRPLPEWANGAVLFVDVAGFLPLTESLAATLGPRRGAEELARRLNTVYDALVAPVHRYGGSLIGFSGDAFIAWFDQDAGLGAVSSALAMQRAMRTLPPIEATGETIGRLSIKAAVAAGPVRRLLVGHAQIQRLDLLTGSTLDRMAQLEHTAQQGEVVVGPLVARHLADRLVVVERRGEAHVVNGLTVEVPPAPWPLLDEAALAVERLRPYLLPPVYERLVAGQGEFLAELRPVVALFLRFAGLDYDHDREAGPKLDAYVRWVQDVCGRYGGTLLQVTTGEKGSYLYAAFGAPVAHEDDAERALAAAVDLRRPPSELAFIEETQIGLSQGRVRTGAYGARTRRTYGALGEEVNLAARLMQAAPTGQIRCSQQLYRAVAGRWFLEPLLPISVKGKTGPIPIYRPLLPQGEQATEEESPLIGRQAELDELRRALDEAGAGRRRVVLLEGEAGIGKSRLVEKVAQIAQGQGIDWLKGAGQSIEPHTPCRAWRDVLAGYFALSEQTDLEERQRCVQEQVIAIDPALAERVPLLNDILRLGLPESALTEGLDPKRRQESLTALVVDLLRDRLQAGPLVLLLEDAHWLDSLSWELALAVAREFERRPLFLLIALRPPEEPRQPAYAALSELAGCETLDLASMAPEGIAALAAARLGLTPDRLPRPVVELLQQRASGNPFFAEELAHALRESGVIEIEEGICTLSGDLEALRESVPDTVEGVVLSRIDRLPIEEQLTLKVAAVIGRSFLYCTLRDVYPHSVIEEILRAHLDDLSRRDMTTLEDLEPELRYLFKHVITQQVAYDTLLFAQRQALHRAVADWYERIYTQELAPFYPLLAYHWNRAEDEERERHYCRLAGEQAAARYANQEALVYLDRALELTPEGDLPGHIDLLLALEQVHGFQGQRAAQADILERLEGLVGRAAEEVCQIELALRQGNYYSVISDYARAGQYLDRAHDGVRALGDRRLEARAHKLRGNVHLYLGELASAFDHYRQAMEIYRALGDRLGEAASLNAMGTARHAMGDCARGQAYRQRALALYRSIGDRIGERNCLNMLGRFARDQGDLATAQAYVTQALATSRAIGCRRDEAYDLLEQGNVQAALGAYLPAQETLEQSWKLFQHINDRRGEGYALCDLGMVYHGLENHDTARDLCQRGLALFQAVGDRWGEAGGLIYLGRALEGLEEVDRAAQAYRRSLALSHEIEQHDFIVESLSGLARVALERGDIEQAMDRAEEIMDRMRRHGITQIEDVSLTYLTVYRVMAAAGEEERARQVLGEAHTLLVERANKIGDETARRSFLENVAGHQAIVSAYQKVKSSGEIDSAGG